MASERATAHATGAFAVQQSNPNSAMLATWQLVRTAPGSISGPADLTFLEDAWIEASAPGTVASALRDAGKWDWSDTSNLDDYDWWYRCYFLFDDVATGASLDFGGLATLADVWLNGTHVLASDNMFIAHSVDVSDALRDDNELVIRFRSLTAALTARRARPKWRTRLASHQNLRWIRTTLLGRMPGWSAVAQPVGPWKSISIIRHDTTRIASRKMHASLDGTDGVVSVTARVYVPTGIEVDAATVSVGTAECAAIVTRSAGGFEISASIRIPHAKIWWPHTHGEQPLYDAVLTLTSGGSIVQLPIGRVAFRRFQLDSADGKFQLHINGEPVFWRGACWSPFDPLRLQCSTDDYRRTLELARDAGMNMLRIGGTMVYEHDDFYDLCDELGIAVWQDLMFANMDYPHADDAFHANVEQEVSQFLQRVAGHASLALVCGNSEVEQQAAMLGLPRSEWRNPLFADSFANLAAEHAPTVPYWPSSPSGGDLPFHVNAGDGHYFGYGPYMRPVSDVRASDVQFASECLALANVPEPVFVDRMTCGTAGAGHHPDWKRGIPRDNGASWDFEDVRDHYVAQVFAVDPALVRYGDPERYLALGRVAGGELMTRTIAEWRRSGSPCGGALVWLYRDLRPGAGWGVLDSDGRPKAAYYYLARAFRPITVLMSDEGLNGISIHAINDTAFSIAPELRVSLVNGSVLVGESTTRLNLAAHSSIDLAADQLLGSFTDVSYAYRFGRPNHDIVIATLMDPDSGKLLAESFHFPLGIGSPRAAAHLETRFERIADETYSLTIGSDELALAVAIEATGCKLSDNYFHIAPGCERIIHLTASPHSPNVAGRVTALNCFTPVGFHA